MEDMMLEFVLATGKAFTCWLRFWPIGPVSLIVAAIATWLCRRIAILLGVVDRPDDSVKTHKEPTPYLGGVAIFAGIVIGLLCVVFCLPEDFPAVARKWLLGIIVACAVACAIGCLDDIFNIKPWQKIIGQVVAALILVSAGIRPMLNPLGGPTGLVVDTAVVIVFVLGAMNALNLLVGLDGLCGGVTAVMAGSMLLLASLMVSAAGDSQGDSIRIVVCLAVLGSTLGFLPFNFHPAKIFMGDAGSLLLGLNMAVIMVLFAEKAPQFWLASIVMFGLPILDTAVAFARRIINKRPLFVPDRGHIYDQMIDRGIPLNKTIAICYLLAGLYAFTGIVISRIKTRYALVVCIAVIVVSAFAVWKLDFLKMEGLRGAKREE
jgi:UDP-GlcNAc:undecaprenyl-phosphate GlcNAc-1-phosphate transferase